MPLLIGMVLAWVSVLVLVWPFLKHGNAAHDDDDPIVGIRRRREAVYEEARVLHNDHLLGDVPLVEYEPRFRAYRVLAAELLRDEERLKDLDSRLEEDILEVRRKAGTEG
jgi:hypothetical protein